ncbi:hypothetical protein A9973_18565 [Achromobacter sp. UMC46]|nr:hypothetical protein [Achromobacter sp. UMC46]
MMNSRCSFALLKNKRPPVEFRAARSGMRAASGGKASGWPGMRVNHEPAMIDRCIHRHSRAGDESARSEQRHGVMFVEFVLVCRKFHRNGCGEGGPTAAPD